MPYPQKGQTKEQYIKEFMESGEARSDFPDEKQRLAVAYSLWEKRNARENALTVGSYGRAEDIWPMEFETNFIEKGVVHYQDLGACKVCGTAGTCGEGKCEPTGEMVLVDNDALAKMAKSFIGKPVIDEAHRDVTPDTIAKGEADGIVTRVWLDGESGWWKARFIVWDPETQKHCKSPAYSVSCAYNPTDVDSSGGTYHNIDFQQKILDGEYTHLAVVTNPRYEGARIQLVNSKDSKGGSIMKWKFWDKGAVRRNASDLDPEKTMVNVEGKEMSLKNLFDEVAMKEKENEMKELGDDTVLEHEGKEMTLGELKQAYRNKMKNAEDALKCPSCNGSGKKTAENADAGADAGHRDMKEVEAKTNAEQDSPVKKPLPDMRDPKQNGGARDEKDQAEAAAKAAEKAAQEKRAMELQQEADARDKKDEAEAAAMKNAEAEAEKKKEEEKRNSARASFLALKNAAAERAGAPAGATVVSMDERLARGKAKYGRKDSVPA